MAIQNLTSPNAILRAIDKCDELGRDKFLETYGFLRANENVLKRNNKEYDSRAIAAVAHGYQFSELGNLSTKDFQGDIAGRRLHILGFDIAGFTRNPQDWTLDECIITVNAYFDCLEQIVNNKQLNKAAVYRVTAPRLRRRSAKAVEYKFQNIEKALFDLGLPRMGMSFAPKYQTLLEYVIPDIYKERSKSLQSIPVELPNWFPVDDVFVQAPTASTSMKRRRKSSNSIKTDYQLQHEENSRVGRLGEKWIVQIEATRLTKAGRPDLANRIIWASKDVGDGLGYDIESFDLDGSSLFIEVKTTKGSIRTPFFITEAEVQAANEKGYSYRLYRVFDFSEKPRVYVLRNPLSTNLRLKPYVYSAFPNN